MKTRYRLVLDFPGYRVDSEGSVWSRWRRTAMGRGLGTKFVLGSAWKRLKLGFVREYRTIQLYRDGRSHRRRVSRLVLECFRGPCPPGMEACHRNGLAGDNALRNLRWGTRKSNQADRRRHGTHLAGSEHPRAKLTTKQVLRLVTANPAAGQARRAWAAKLKIDVSTINRILRGSSYGSITKIRRNKDVADA